MRMNPFGNNPRRGSALLASMIVVTVLSFAAAGILSYSLNTYENSMRQALLDQAREVADSEMEYLYFQWKTVLIARQIPIDQVTLAPSPLATFKTPAGSTVPTYDKAFHYVPTSLPQWQVTRDIKFNFLGPVTGDGSAEGIVQGNLIGKNYYFTAWTSATYSSPVLGTVTFRSGRNFAYSSTPLFQYAVFYQGNLELAPGGNMVINGPVSTNSSAYLSAHTGFKLTLTDQVAYYNEYNGSVDPALGETDYLEASNPTWLTDPTSVTLVDPVYNPNPNSAAPGDQTAQRAIQVTKLKNQASFIGGVDVQADITPGGTYSAAYTPAGETVPDPNEIYRAVIAPPPLAADGVTPLVEDPVIAAARMYNTAGVLITINQTSTVPNAVPTISIGNATNPTAYNSDFPTVLAPGNGQADPVTHAPDPSVLQTVRTPIIDPREYANNISAVNMTTLDIGNLKTQLAIAMAADPTLAAKYNGVLYIYDKTDDNGVLPSTPAGGIAPGTLDAIRLTNGSQTPDYRDNNNNPLGFSVVSNNGVYIQGDYNTTQITVPGVGQPVNNPTAVMGDAVTALSTGWSQDNQKASLGAMVVNDLGNRTPSLPTSDNDIMTIQTAILTGNTPSAGTGANQSTDYNSGGAQNLVRMVENWNPPAPDGNHLTLALDGSLGQLFTSKYFKGPYTGSGLIAKLIAQDPTLPSSDPGYIHANPVYTQPPTRVFQYDTGFKERAPAGAPTTTGFTRGDFFFW